MKFIHTADLHLDSPFDNLKGGQMPEALWHLIYQSTYRSFSRIIDAAIRERVQMVLIVGDLFDREVRSVRAQAFLKRCLERLNQHRILAFMSFGNHDYYRGNYRDLRYPPNTYVFPTRVTTKTLTLADGKRVGITGFSYGSRWESQRMIQQFPSKGEVDYQIGMIHGQVSSGKANYTPFSLAELKAKHYDYWALGHIHKRQELSDQPPVWYCGNIQGRNPNETGEKGYLLVDSKRHFQPQFHATSVINWQTLTVKIRSVKNEQQLIEQILDFLNHQHFQKMHLLQLKLLSNQDLPSSLVMTIRNGNCLAQLQAALQQYYEKMNVWVYRIQLENSKRKAVRLDQHYWQRSAQQVFTIDNVDQLAKKLFRDSFINQRFNHLSSVKELRRQAQQLIQDCRSQDHDY